MKWLGKNVLLTGATGLLGGHFAKRLVSDGANVVALVRDGVPNCIFYQDGLDKAATVVRGQLEDYCLIERVLNEYEIEACFHLGAQTIVGTANRSPLSTFEANIKGTWNVLEAARNSTLLKALVVASTDKAYGEGSLPYKETDRLAANHHYDASKACAEMICSSYFHSYGMPIGVTRCGNIFGEGDLNFNRIIPGAIRSVLMKEPLLIRSDGKMVRDYIYVQDVVEANMLLAEFLLRGEQKGEVFNFSLEQPQSVLEVVGRVLRMMKSDLKPSILNSAQNEIQSQYLSAEKAHRNLGWKPKWDFDSGLARTIAWYKKYLRYQ
jgi:CDP-glucose 4,6-dehydratase